MNTISKSLFEKETVFISEGGDTEKVFKDISDHLSAQDLVTENFLENLLEREKNYPTGIDLSIISNELPNIAIPHTESEYVKVRRIIPVKLIEPVAFKNMIQPEKELEVSFLFMLLNNSPNEQANMLAEVMDFLNQTEEKELKQFFDATDEEAIYHFLKLNFK